MEILIPIFRETCWYVNIIGLVFVALVRSYFNTKLAWAVLGCLLLFFSIGNAMILSNAGLSPNQEGASLFGLVVLGSLGSRFVGNWLTEGAK